MGLAHDRHYSDTRRGSDGLGDKSRQDVFLVVFGDGGDDGGQWRNIVDLVLLRELGSQAVEVNVLLRTAVLGGFMVFDERVRDVGTASKESVVFGRQAGVLLAASYCDRCCRHGCAVSDRRPSYLVVVDFGVGV